MNGRLVGRLRAMHFVSARITVGCLPRHVVRRRSRVATWTGEIRNAAPGRWRQATRHRGPSPPPEFAEVLVIVLIALEAFNKPSCGARQLGHTLDRGKSGHRMIPGSMGWYGPRTSSAERSPDLTPTAPPDRPFSGLLGARKAWGGVRARRGGTVPRGAVRVRAGVRLRFPLLRGAVTAIRRCSIRCRRSRIAPA